MAKGFAGTDAQGRPISCWRRSADHIPDKGSLNKILPGGYEGNESECNDSTSLFGVQRVLIDASYPCTM